MPNPVVHFGIYYDDAARAKAFYETVFGWTVEAWGPPGFFTIDTGDGPEAARGALSARTDPRGSGGPNAYRCTISVTDLDATLDRIAAHGGRRASETNDIPGIGRAANFEDTEGNLACVMQYVSGSPPR